MTGLRNTLTSISVFLITAVVSVAAVELGVRLVLPQYSPAGRLAFVPGAAGRPDNLGEPNSSHHHVKWGGDFDVTVDFNRHGLRDAKDLAE